MELPVYLFTGFLEAGKTRFIQETLEDERFNAGERTLLLVCEEGVEEYAPEQFSGKNVFIEVLDDSSQLNADHLAKLQMAHNAERCVVEYNGMWLLDDLYQKAIYYSRLTDPTLQPDGNCSPVEYKVYTFFGLSCR